MPTRPTRPWGQDEGQDQELVKPWTPPWTTARSLAVVTEMLRGTPAVPVVIGLPPALLPHRFNEGGSEGDRRPERPPERHRNGPPRYGVDSLKEYFAGICDLCYLGFQGAPWTCSHASEHSRVGSVYRVALGELKALDIPVLNLGLREGPHKPPRDSASYPWRFSPGS